MSAKSPIDPLIEFPKVEKMLYQLAHQFAGKYPYPNEEEMFEECRSVSYLAFMQACQSYNPKRKAKFITWCYKITWYRLKDMIMNRSQEPSLFEELHEDLIGDKTLKQLFDANELFRESTSPKKQWRKICDAWNCVELTEGLSDDAKEIISLILDTPHDFATTPRKLLQKVKICMVQNQERWKKDVDAAHRELTIKLQNV